MCHHGLPWMRQTAEPPPRTEPARRDLEEIGLRKLPRLLPLYDGEEFGDPRFDDCRAGQ